MVRNEKGQFVKGMAPHNKKSSVSHGQVEMYWRGCRCDDCVKANTVYCANSVRGTLTVEQRRSLPCSRCGEGARVKGATICRLCRNEESRIRMNAKGRRLTPEQYAEMFTAQNGCCKICNQPETQTRNGMTKELAEDHCHTTGVVRGLLCAKHNTALGQFNDDIALLESAIAYLKAAK